MIQFIVIMPLIFLLIDKWGKIGLLCCFVCNFLFEAFVKIEPLFPASLYRLLIIRYIFLLGLGCYAAYIQKKGWSMKKSILCLMFSVGAFYILFTNHFRLPDGSYSWSIQRYWQGTGLLVGFYMFPFFYLMLKKWKDYIPPEHGIIEFFLSVGKASWHIFLVQTFYFSTLYLKWKEFFANFNMALELTVNMILCIGFGILFWCFENYVRNKKQKI